MKVDAHQCEKFCAGGGYRKLEMVTDARRPSQAVHLPPWNSSDCLGPRQLLSSCSSERDAFAVLPASPSSTSALPSWWTCSCLRHIWTEKMHKGLIRLPGVSSLVHLLFSIHFLRMVWKILFWAISEQWAKSSNLQSMVVFLTLRRILSRVTTVLSSCSESHQFACPRHVFQLWSHKKEQWDPEDGFDLHLKSKFPTQEQDRKGVARFLSIFTFYYMLTSINCFDQDNSVITKYKSSLHKVHKGFCFIFHETGNVQLSVCHADPNIFRHR